MTTRAKRYMERKRVRRKQAGSVIHSGSHFEICMPADVETAIKEANRKFWENILTGPYLRSIK